jgi:uncharacterized protein
MQAIYIPHLLQRPQQSETHLIDEFLSGLETLTPIRGTLIVRHGGTFLEVKLVAETIVTLVCDRCVQHYNYRLNLETSELIWLQRPEVEPESIAKEREISWEDLTEVLSPDGHFDADEWLFEQVSLALPLRKLCGKNCQPPDLPEGDRESQLDGRWANLASLKNQLP